MQYEMPVETELEEYVRREGTPEDWSKMKQIKKGENLKSFLTDKNWVIRGLLVEKGYFLDILVNDSNSLVRQRVATYGTDKCEFKNLFLLWNLSQGYCKLTFGKRVDLSRLRCSPR